jgi:glycosyltransferase involved in cell wall biosynthesis
VSEKEKVPYEKIKVLHIITVFSIGGATENTLFSVEGLNTLGYDVSILTGPNISTEGDLFQRAKANNVKVEILECLQRNISPLNDLKAFYCIYKKLKSGNYDIVHTHSSKAGIIGRIAAKAAKVPVIIHTIHGLPFHNYQSKFIHYLYVKAERIGATLSDKLITVSNLIISKALNEKVGTADKFVTVRSGFEMEEFIKAPVNSAKLKEKLNLSDNNIVIGKIARFSRLKGHQYILKVIPDVIKEVPNAIFLFVGSGELLGEYEKKVKELGIEKNVRFAGLVKNEDIPEYIKIIDIVVHTSLLEGLARIFPQSMAAQKPVVSFNIDGAPEVIIDGETGFLVDPEDCYGLTQKIIKLAKDKEMRERFGKKGKEIVMSEWNIESMVKGIDKVYKELIKRNLKENNKLSS